MKKSTKFLGLLTAVLTLSAFGCSNNAADLNSDASNEGSRTYYGGCYSVTLKSDLNPGYGKAVFFTGTFNEGKNWTTAVRGSYDSENGWTCPVHFYDTMYPSNTIEWKALTGNYDLGETVNISFDGLTEINVENSYSLISYNDGLSFNYSVPYGKSIFYCENGYKAFFGSTGAPDFESVAIRGTYDTSKNVWNFGTLNKSLYTHVHTFYVGDFSLGEKVQGVFHNLTWEEGENHTYSRFIN